MPLSVDGGGIVILGGASNNVYTGNTTVVSGSTLIVAKRYGLGTKDGIGDATTTVQSGAALVFTGGINVVAPAPIFVSGPGSAPNGGGSFHAIDALTGSNTFAGAITLGDNATIGNESDGRFVENSNINNAGFLLTVANNGNQTGNAPANPAASALYLDGTISGTGGMNIDNGGLGTGYVILGGGFANTFTGDTTVVDGSLILSKADHVNAIGGNLIVGIPNPTIPAFAQYASGNQISDTASVTVEITHTLDLNGFSDAIGSLTLNGGSVTTGSGTLTLLGDLVSTDEFSSFGNLTVSSSISGNLDLGGVSRNVNVSTAGVPLPFGPRHQCRDQQRHVQQDRQRHRPVLRQRQQHLHRPHHRQPGQPLPEQVGWRGRRGR